MSILPGSEGRRDPERAEAARRQRVRFARDIGDEHGIAWAHEPRRAKQKFTIGVGIVLAAFALLGAIPLLTHHGDGLLSADCATAAVEVGPHRVDSAGSYAWQAAGPETGSYVVTIDATSVSVDAAGRATAAGGTVLFGPAGLPGCRSKQTVTTAPIGVGEHEVAVFRRSATGWDRVAASLLRVG